ncbi:hypothetical protein D9M71_688300 [compost metagenome]
MATVIVPASQPFMRSTASAMKKKAIGNSAIRLDSQRLPAGSYSCSQGCMRILDKGEGGPPEGGDLHGPEYWCYQY